MILGKRQIIDEAYSALRETYGDAAEFREGQLEAIIDAVQHRKVLIVQKTGWGKSIVYFVAANILRRHGAGPILIISPLLALMENQMVTARQLGIKAVSINSSNREGWPSLYNSIRAGNVDAVIVSPEKLSDLEFLNALARIPNIQLLVVDEAHSISDWGHDFRPDYQRVNKLLRNLPQNIGVLGTTATANERVVRDIKSQLGSDLIVNRGDLMRCDIAVQVNKPQSKAERMAWIASALGMRGVLHANETNQGIIYCLTKKDCDKVANWLNKNGILAASYHSGLSSSEARQVLDDFYQRRLPVIVATIKLGMGYDKQDVRFVIHYQLPENLISYYQQIGRAGRDGKGAIAILMHGREDDETLQYFIDNAFSSPFILDKIVNLADGKHTYTEMLSSINIKKTAFDSALKYLQVHDFIYRDERTHYYMKNLMHVFNKAKEQERQNRINAIRLQELEDVREFVSLDGCYMKYIANKLDAPDMLVDCRICANCTNSVLVSPETSRGLTVSARKFLNNGHGVIKCKKSCHNGGWILSDDYYSDIGRLVKTGKYEDEYFSKELVSISAKYLLKNDVRGRVDLVVPVPSINHPRLVPDFAKRLSRMIKIDYADVLTKMRGAPDQKTLMNKYVQCKNIRESVSVAAPRDVVGRTILLVDDMTDSRATFDVISKKLMDAGARGVFLYALVDTGGTVL